VRAAADGRPGSAEAAAALAERVLARCLRPGDEGIELFLHDVREANLDLVPGLPGVLAAAGGGAGSAVRVWRAGRCGFAAGDVSREDEIAALVATARAQAVTAGIDAAMPVDVPAAAGVGASPMAPDEDLARQRAEELRTMLAGAGLGVQVVLIRRRRSWATVASTAGVRTTEWHDRVTALARCETVHGTLVDAVECADLSAHWDAGPLLGRVAEAGALISAARRREPDRRLPLVLRPAVASQLVAGLGWLLLGTTAASTIGLPGAVGRRLFPSRLTLIDDPGHPGLAQPRAVDDEGRPAAPVVLVREGVLQGFLHSTASAAAVGARPNGRAIRADVSAPPAPAALGLLVRPRGDVPPGDHVELTTRFETLSTMPRPGIVTLVVAGWEVRDGNRAHAVGPFDLELPVVATLRALRGAGSDLEVLPAAGRCGTPSLELAEAAWSH